MKRRITVDQVNELTREQRNRLNDLWTPEKYDIFIKDEALFATDYFEMGKIFTVEEEQDHGQYEYDKQMCLPLLDIGQLFELLQQSKKKYFNCGFIDDVSIDIEAIDGLCDTLWNAVKEIL